MTQQREDFEAWFTKAYNHASLKQVENGCYTTLGAGMAWDAWMAAQAQGCPQNGHPSQATAEPELTKSNDVYQEPVRYEPVAWTWDTANGTDPCWNEAAEYKALLRQCLDVLSRVDAVDADCDILSPSLAEAVSDAIEAIGKVLP